MRIFEMFWRRRRKRRLCEAIASLESARGYLRFSRPYSYGIGQGADMERTGHQEALVLLAAARLDVMDDLAYEFPECA